MSTTQALVHTLKAELKRAGITYAVLARELGLAESSVKRIFARGDMPLSRIDEVLAVLKMDFGELAALVAQATPVQRELTAEQEGAVVADARLLLVAICCLSQWRVAEIVETYTLTRGQALACLQALERIGFLQRRGDDDYRLKIDKTFRWRPDGPVMRFFRRHAVADYFAGDFGGPGELLTLVHGQIAPQHAVQFNERLNRLAMDFAHQHLADRRLPAADRQAYTVVFGMRSWLFGAFRELLRKAPA
jgi:lambda repressor-like predicted transcriptional regulator